MGQEQYSNPGTLRRWFKRYRDLGRCFPHPNPKTAMSKPLPPFLEDNPDIKTAFMNHAKNNLAKLSIESMYDYVHAELVPKIVKDKHKKFIDAKKEEDEIVLLPPKQDVLAELGLRTIGMMTIYKWMLALGFRHKDQTKCYYLDGHEREGTQLYQKKFTKAYLKAEFRCYPRIQVSLKQVIEFKERVA